MNKFLVPMTKKFPPSRDVVKLYTALENNACTKCEYFQLNAHDIYYHKYWEKILRYYSSDIQHSDTVTQHWILSKFGAKIEKAYTFWMYAVAD